MQHDHAETPALERPGPTAAMCRETMRTVGRLRYDSIMCSTPVQRIAQIGQAIDNLAAQADAAGAATRSDAGTAAGSAADAGLTRARARGLDEDQVVLRVAELWAQLAQLDPEVAKRLPTYEA